MPDVDSKLLTGLRQAKTTPMFFAFVAKGANDGALIVAKKKISTKEINEAKAACGGKLVFQGRCQGEGAKTIFEVPKEPPGTLAKQLKTVIQRDAGMNTQVEVRVKADLEEGEEEGEEKKPDADELRFGQRLKELAPAVQKALATKSPKAEQAKLKISEANSCFRQQEFVQANALLDEAEALVQQALAGPAPSPPPPPAPPPKPPAQPAPAKTPPRPAAKAPAAKAAPTAEELLQAEWERRVIALEPGVLQAKKTRPTEAKWMTLFMQVQDLGGAGEFAEAIQILDKIELLLSGTPVNAPEGAEKLFVARQIARLRWNEMLKKVPVELQKLEKSVLDKCAAVNNDADEEVEVDLVEVAEKLAQLDKDLNDMLDDIDTRLLGKLDEALNAQSGARQQKHQEAIAILKECQAKVNSDPLLTLIDKNGFAPVSIKQSIVAVLNELSTKL